MERRRRRSLPLRNRALLCPGCGTGPGTLATLALRTVSFGHLPVGTVLRALLLPLSGGGLLARAADAAETATTHSAVVLYRAALAEGLLARREFGHGRLRFRFRRRLGRAKGLRRRSRRRLGRSGWGGGGRMGGGRMGGGERRWGRGHRPVCSGAWRRWVQRRRAARLVGLTAGVVEVRG